MTVRLLKARVPPARSPPLLPPSIDVGIAPSLPLCVRPVICLLRELTELPHGHFVLAGIEGPGDRDAMNGPFLSSAAVRPHLKAPGRHIDKVHSGLLVPYLHWVTGAGISRSGRLVAEEVLRLYGQLEVAAQRLGQRKVCRQRASLYHRHERWNRVLAGRQPLLPFRESAGRMLLDT